MGKKIRVAMIVDNPCNPDARVWRSAKTLAELGFDVTLYAQKELGISEEEIIDGVLIKRVFQYKLGTSVLIEKYLSAHFQLKEAIQQEERFDIFHCHDPETWPIGYIFANEQKAKWIADSHEYFPDYIEKSYYNDDVNKYNTAVQLAKNRGKYIEKADGLITVSEETLNALKNDYQLTCPSTVIYNTRLTETIIKENKKQLRSKLGLEEDKRYLIFAGNITEDRGMDRTLEIVKFLPENYKFILIGEGLSLNETEKIKDLQEKVLYLGKLPYNDLVRYVHASDGYLYFPKYHDNMMRNYKYTIPNKIFDAIFSNIPFFSLRRFSFSKIIEKYNVGRTFDNNCSNEFIAKDIVNKIEDTNYSYENYKDAQLYFSWEYQKQKLANLYSNVLKGSE